MPIANDNAVIQTVVPKDLKQWLAQQAKIEGRSLSNYVSYLLEQAQEKDRKQSSGNQATK